MGNLFTSLDEIGCSTCGGPLDTINAFSMCEECAYGGDTNGGDTNGGDTNGGDTNGGDTNVPINLQDADTKS